MKGSVVALGAALVLVQAAPYGPVPSIPPEHITTAVDATEQIQPSSASVPISLPLPLPEEGEDELAERLCKAGGNGVFCHTKTLVEPGFTVWATKPIVIPIAHTRTIAVLQPSPAGPTIAVLEPSEQPSPDVSSLSAAPSTPSLAPYSALPSAEPWLEPLPSLLAGPEVDADSDADVADSDGEVTNSDDEVANSDGEVANSDGEVANSDGEVANSDTEVTDEKPTVVKVETEVRTEVNTEAEYEVVKSEVATDIEVKEVEDDEGTIVDVPSVSSASSAPSSSPVPSAPLPTLSPEPAVFPVPSPTSEAENPDSSSCPADSKNCHNQKESKEIWESDSNSDEDDPPLPAGPIPNSGPGYETDENKGYGSDEDTSTIPAVPSTPLPTLSPEPAVSPVPSPTLEAENPDNTPCPPNSKDCRNQKKESKEIWESDSNSDEDIPTIPVGAIPNSGPGFDTDKNKGYESYENEPAIPAGAIPKNKGYGSDEDDLFIPAGAIPESGPGYDTDKNNNKGYGSDEDIPTIPVGVIPDSSFSDDEKGNKGKGHSSKDHHDEKGHHGDKSSDEYDLFSDSSEDDRQGRGRGGHGLDGDISHPLPPFSHDDDYSHGNGFPRPGFPQGYDHGGYNGDYDHPGYHGQGSDDDYDNSNNHRGKGYGSHGGYDDYDVSRNDHGNDGSYGGRHGYGNHGGYHGDDGYGGRNGDDGYPVGSNGYGGDHDYGLPFPPPRHPYSESEYPYPPQHSANAENHGNNHADGSAPPGFSPDGHHGYGQDDGGILHDPRYGGPGGAFGDGFPRRCPPGYSCRSLEHCRDPFCEPDVDRCSATQSCQPDDASHAAPPGDGYPTADSGREENHGDGGHIPPPPPVPCGPGNSSCIIPPPPHVPCVGPTCIPAPPHVPCNGTECSPHVPAPPARTCQYGHPCLDNSGGGHDDVRHDGDTDSETDDHHDGNTDDETDWSDNEGESNCHSSDSSNPCQPHDSPPPPGASHDHIPSPPAPQCHISGTGHGCPQQKPDVPLSPPGGSQTDVHHDGNTDDETDWSDNEGESNCHSSNSCQQQSKPHVTPPSPGGSHDHIPSPPPPCHSKGSNHDCPQPEPAPLVTPPQQDVPQPPLCQPGPVHGCPQQKTQVPLPPPGGSQTDDHHDGNTDDETDDHHDGDTDDETDWSDNESGIPPPPPPCQSNGTNHDCPQPQPVPLVTPPQREAPHPPEAPSEEHVEEEQHGGFRPGPPILSPGCDNGFNSSTRCGPPEAPAPAPAPAPPAPAPIPHYEEGPTPAPHPQPVPEPYYFPQPPQPPYYSPEPAPPHPQPVPEEPWFYPQPPQPPVYSPEPAPPSWEGPYEAGPVEPQPGPVVPQAPVPAPVPAPAPAPAPKPKPTPTPVSGAPAPIFTAGASNFVASVGLAVLVALAVGAF
ncbi:hypothetical protein QBC35DRAFT_449157 [Podospora australis]|uniref:Uncharacterized protein n=1 Tax=Podospora australis TaxID=1536484 RepID=A0AAN6WYU5_9PEZI|nr:hypothetical protein QBC35DRAFT_449157 [Podospora australis]